MELKPGQQFDISAAPDSKAADAAARKAFERHIAGNLKILSAWLLLKMRPTTGLWSRTNDATGLPSHGKRGVAGAKLAKKAAEHALTKMRIR